MHSIILAAGQGTRLKHLTAERPKCMVPFAGVPLLHRQISVLKRNGVKTITLVGGYRSDLLDSAGAEIVLNPDYAVTNMVATLFSAESKMQQAEDAEEDLLLSYGDIIFEDKVFSSIEDGKGEISVVVDRNWKELWATRMDDPLQDAETMKLTDGDKIVELGKKPTGYDEIQGQYIGLIKVRADKINAFRKFWHEMDRDRIYDGKDFPNMYMTSFIQELIDAGWDVRAAFIDNGWLEVDTVEDLAEYENMFKDGSLDKFYKVDQDV